MAASATRWRSTAIRFTLCEVGRGRSPARADAPVRRRRSRWRAVDPFSSYSHLAGVVLAIAALVALVATSGDDPRRLVGFSTLYAASTVYHWAFAPFVWRVRLNRLDHVAVFLLIAGTYTPICLVTLQGPWGWTMLGVVWSAALAGTIVKLGFASLPRWISTGLYLAMGWVAVFAIVPIARVVPVPGVLWLVAGGLLYTAGAIVYAIRRPDPYPRVFGFHEIFHLFVLAGSASHFVFMLRYVAPA
jgi:hemolysin III